MHEDETGAPIPTAQIGGRLLPERSDHLRRRFGLDELPHPIRGVRDIGIVDGAVTRDDFQHQVRRRGEVLVEEVSDLCRLRGRVGETSDAKLLGHRSAEDDADGE